MSALNSPNPLSNRRTKRPYEQKQADLVKLASFLVAGDLVEAAVQKYAAAVNISVRQAWTDYGIVKRGWATRAEELALDPNVGLGLALLRRDQMFRAAMRNDDVPTALQVEQDRAKLIDLYPREGKTTGRAATVDPMARYLKDPAGYARDVLKVQPTAQQEAIALSLLEPPYRSLVKSGHNVGKSFLAAWLINWWYDTRNPSWTVSTAPNQRSVRDILWTEVRLQRQKAGLSLDHLAPSDAVMKDGPEHQAKGYTASKGESFQGRHRDRMFFVFDEAEGVAPVYWDAAGTMFRPNGDDAWLCILNPLTTTSKAAQEERATQPDGSPKWRVFTLNALDHPNVLVGLANRARREKGEPEQPLPVPSAVTLEQAETWLSDWFEPVPDGDHDPATDIQWPPDSGNWLRPDGEGEARVLGRRPTAGAYGVWSERVWALAERENLPPLSWELVDLPEIGCDVARFGTDRTEIHVRCGPCSLHHEEHSGWDTTRTADRLREMAAEWAKWTTAQRNPAAAAVQPEDIRVKVDDTGVGGGVTDMCRAWGLTVVAVNAGESAQDYTKYPRVRDELWFVTRDRAKAGRLDLSRLPKKRREQLRQQALAPVWSPAPDGRRVVESKDKTKERTGQKSPDSMDALNLAYLEAGGDVPRIVGG